MSVGGFNKHMEGENIVGHMAVHAQRAPGPMTMDSLEEGELLFASAYILEVLEGDWSSIEASLEDVSTSVSLASLDVVSRDDDDCVHSPGEELSKQRYTFSHSITRNRAKANQQKEAKDKRKKVKKPRGASR